MVAAGNHESECHSPKCLAEEKLKKELSNFTAYATRFKMPFAQSKGTSNMWYSHNYGLAHFVTLDTEVRHSRHTVIPFSVWRVVHIARARM
jgi:hypothetical protein